MGICDNTIHFYSGQVVNKFYVLWLMKIDRKMKKMIGVGSPAKHGCGLSVIMIIDILVKTKPASDQFGFYKYVYDHYNGKSATMLSRGPHPYHLLHFTIYFHQPKDIKFVDNLSTVKMDSIIANAHKPLLVAFESKQGADSFARSHPLAKM